MAAVAPAAPVPVASAPEDEAAVAPTVHSDEPVDADDDHHDDDHENDDEDEEHEEEVVKEWDEGGKSHCGYGDSVHETLMSIGQSIHKVVGEPSETVQSAMQSVGNWFQEASYAARDLKRGKMDMAEETAAAMKSVVANEDEEDKGEGDDVGEGGDESKEEEEGETKLESVKEDIAKEEAASP